ncbi:MAG TPA: PAS domain S-box protein [Gammaproteobacteria bacterium]|nr:PAS domain S-box protein [Gammaproteobacteria bacterium]
MIRKKTAPPPSGGTPAHETIMVVEDNPITLKLVQVTLQKEGYQVIAVGDGRTALEHATGRMPRLILQDLKLPDIDGADLVRKLRALPGGEGVPIIAFTGFVTKVEQGIIADVGFTDFLIKPVEPSQLLAVIRTYLLPSKTVDEKPGHGRRLLLVDDDPTQLKYSRLQFTNAGFEVIAVRSGQEALDLAQKQPPDAIVSDVLMPGMDGFELCYAVRREPRLRKVPVVLMSANYLEQADRDLAERIGASAYVSRAVGVKEILNAVVQSLSSPVPTHRLHSDEEFEKERHARVTSQLDRILNLRVGAMQRGYAQAAILNELSLISETLTRGRDTDSALKGILAHCLDGAGLSKGLLYLVDDQDRLQLHVQYGCDKLLSAAQNLFGQQELFTEFLRAEYPVQVPSPALPTGAAEVLLRQVESESALIIPVPKNNGGRGLLALFSTSLNLVEEDWVAFGRSLASQIGQTIALSQTILKLVKSEQELRRYGEIVATTTDLLAFKDADNRYVVVNDQVCKYFKLPREQIIGHTSPEFFRDKQFGQVIKDYAERCLKGETVQAEHWLDYPGMGRRYMNLSYHPFRDASGNITGVVTVASDITSRKRQEDELKYINRALKALSVCNAVLVRSVNEQRFLSEFCNILVDEIGFKMVWVGRAERDEARTVRPLAQAGFEQGYLERIKVTWADNELGHGPVGTAIRTGKHCAIQNIFTDPAFTPWREEASKRGYASVAALPLIVSEQMYGSLNFYAAEPDAFGDREIILLNQLANEFAHGIEFLHTRKEREKTQAALRESEALLRLFIEHAPAAIAMFDLDMRYLAVSRRWLSDYKLGDQNLIGRSHYEVFPEIPERWREVHQRCLAGASEVCEEDRFDRADGSVQWERWEVRPWRRGDGGIGGILIFTVDITERKRTSDELQQRLDQQAAISRLGQFALVMRNPATVENEAVAILTHTLRVEYCDVLRKIPDQRNAWLLSAGHGWRKGLVGHAIMEIEKRTQASYTLKSKTPVIVEDINEEKRFNAIPLLVEHGIVSGVSIIIGDVGNPLGILGVHSTRKRKFTDNDVHFIGAIANILAESQMRFEKEQLLARAEQRFAHLINSSPSVIYATSRDKPHRCNFVSNTIRDIVGIEPEVMQNDPDFWPSHVHPEDLPRVIAEMEALERGESGTVEYRFLCKGDEYRWIRDNFRVVGKEIIGSWTDITASHEAELKVKESEERFRLLIEGVRDYAIFMIDPQGRVITWNDGARRLKGYVAEEIIGRSIERFYKPEDIAAGIPAQMIARAQAVGHSETEGWRVRRNGSQFYANVVVTAMRDPNGKLLGFVKLTRDVTQRVEAEAALKKSEERFRTVAAASNDMIYEWDPHTNELTWHGDVGAALGYGPGEFDRTLAGWENSIHPEDRERVITAVDAHLRDPSKPFSEEYRVRCKDGSYRHWLDQGMVIKGADKAEGRWIGACADITQRKHMEQQLAQSQKMDAVGQLTGGVAHDFNNRLTAIIGNLELLERRFKDDATALRYVHAALKAAEGGASLTRSLLAFSRKQVFEAQVFDINDLIQSTQELLQRALGETIKIEVAPAADLWQVRTDRGMMENVLLNLAINARDAMPGGGVLTIETTNCTLDSAYVTRHAQADAGEYVLVAVSDTGTGMSEEVRRHAFEPFFTTKERGKGTGLGLSMAYGFAKQSGGHIEIYSEVGHGTSIKLYLPRHRKGASADKTSATTTTSTWGKLGGQKILLVEDDPAVLAITTSALTEMGCQVISAENGPAALECFARHPDIVLLFTDVVMPGGMTGVELALKLRTQRPELRVLYTSGYAPQAAANHISKTENDFWLAKPYRAHALQEAVRRALGVTEER